MGFPLQRKAFGEVAAVAKEIEHDLFDPQRPHLGTYNKEFAKKNRPVCVDANVGYEVSSRS